MGERNRTSLQISNHIMYTVPQKKESKSNQLLY